MRLALALSLILPCAAHAADAPKEDPKPAPKAAKPAAAPAKAAAEPEEDTMARLTAYEASKLIYRASAERTREENRVDCGRGLSMVEAGLIKHPDSASLARARAEAAVCLAGLADESEAEQKMHRAMALRDLDVLLHASPRDHELYAERAAARCAPACEGEELQKAIADLEKAMSLQPARKEYRAELVKRYREAGLEEKAADLEARTAAGEDRRDVKAWEEEQSGKYSQGFLGLVFLRRDPAKLASAAKDLVKLCSDVLERLDDPKKKAEWFSRRAAARSYPEPLSMEERLLALEDYDKAVEADPENAKRYADRSEFHCPRPECEGPAKEKAARDLLRAAQLAEDDAMRTQYQKKLMKLNGIQP